MVVLRLQQHLLNALGTGRERAGTVAQVVQDERKVLGIPVDEHAALRSQPSERACWRQGMEMATAAQATSVTELQTT